MKLAVLALCCVLGAAAPAAAQRDVRPTAKPAVAAPEGKGTDVSVVVLSDDQAARPLRRVSVSLQLGLLSSPRTVVTDDDGRAVFTAVAPGNYLLIAFKPGYVRTYYGSKTPGRGPGVAVAVLEGKAVPELRMKVPRGGVISGTVRSVTGRPAANQMVQVMSPNALKNMSIDALNESTANVATTDDRGIYRVYGLAPGSYIVSVASAGMREEFRQVTAEQVQWASALSASGTLPAASEPPPPPPSAPASFSSVFYPGTAVAADAQPVAVEAGQERLGVDFGIMLVPTAQISGRLVDQEGRPQPNQSVTMRAPASSPMGLEFIESIGFGGGGRTGPDGTFTLTGVKPGRYTLSARATIKAANEPAGTPQANAMGEALAMLGMGGGTHWASEEITVAGRDVTDVTLVLKPSLTITGKVTYEASTLKAPEDMTTVRLAVTSVSDEPASAVTTMIQSMFGGSSVTVAADGTFVAKGLTPGTYRIMTAGGVIASLAPTERVEGWTLKSVMAGGRDVADTGLNVKDNVSNVIVTFTDRPSELAGTVFDQAGRVTPEFPIVVFSTDKAYWLSGSRRVTQARPASDGTFKVTGLPAGDYYVCAVTAVEQSELADPAFLEQLAASSYKIKITIRAGEKTVQDLKLGGG
jgi:hypothetical protein